MEERITSATSGEWCVDECITSTATSGEWCGEVAIVSLATISGCEIQLWRYHNNDHSSGIIEQIMSPINHHDINNHSDIPSHVIIHLIPNASVLLRKNRIQLNNGSIHR